MEYYFKDDEVYVFLPCPNYGEGVVKMQLVMTKEVFIACYEKWIKNAKEAEE